MDMFAPQRGAAQTAQCGTLGVGAAARPNRFSPRMAHVYWNCNTVAGGLGKFLGWEDITQLRNSVTPT